FSRDRFFLQEFCGFARVQYRVTGSDCQPLPPLLNSDIESHACVPQRCTSACRHATTPRRKE
ncbi:MAG: hypothetical protein AAB209_13245, partial [Bacteroidota bacterium]